MKKLSFIALSLLLLFSCTVQKNAARSWKDYTINSPCPPKSECYLEVLENKSLLVKSDNGHIYYNLQDNPGTNVVKYIYKTITDSKLQDAGYSENLIFETDGRSFNYTDMDIQKTKMLFNVQCFCRGKAGLRKVNKGIAKYDGKKLLIEIPVIVEGQNTKKVDISFN